MNNASLAGELYEKFKPKITKLASKYPVDMFDDMMQEAYLGVHRAVEKSTHPDFVPYPYLLAFVRFYMQDYFHKNYKPLTVSRKVDHSTIRIIRQPNLDTEDYSNPESILIAIEQYKDALEDLHNEDEKCEG